MLQTSPCCIPLIISPFFLTAIDNSGPILNCFFKKLVICVGSGVDMTDNVCVCVCYYFNSIFYKLIS